MLELDQLNNKTLFRQKLISSTITIVFLITVMGVAALFAIWNMEREYNQNLLKVNGLKNISEELSLAQLNLKSADQEWKNLIIRARDKETKIKYKSLSKTGKPLYVYSVQKCSSETSNQKLCHR